MMSKEEKIKMVDDLIFKANIIKNNIEREDNLIVKKFISKILLDIFKTKISKEDREHLADMFDFYIEMHSGCDEWCDIDFAHHNEYMDLIKKIKKEAGIKKE